MEEIKDGIIYLTSEIKFESDALSVKEALSSLTLAASMGLDIFLIISLVGSFLILGVFSYVNNYYKI